MGSLAVNSVWPAAPSAHWQNIEELAGGIKGLTVLKGVELDILEDGTLDLPDEVLAEADWVVASIHYGQNQPREKITQRLLNAIRNPYVDAIGHPTGRLIGKRIDLDDVALMAAREHGVPVVISTDAHAPEELAFMEFGVSQARRAWLQATDVINTRPLSRLRKRLRRHQATVAS
jgi:DNA polymerase (family X)